VFTAYFDESGHVDSKQFVAVAGFVASDKQWRNFDIAWQAALTKHKAPFLHTTDLMNYKREFKNWNRSQEDALMRDLVDVLHSTGRVVAVGAVMAVDDFKVLSRDMQSRLRNPVFTLFQQVVSAAALEAFGAAPGTVVNMVYSQTNEFGSDFSKIVALMKQLDPRIGNLQFADMRLTPGLQVADLLSYELYRYYKNKRKTPTVRTRWALRQILIPQHIMNLHFVKTVPLWHLKLQWSRWWRPLMSLLTVVIAIPTFLSPRVFAKLNRAPELLPEDYVALREAVRRWKAERRRSERLKYFCIYPMGMTAHTRSEVA
jgi:Protein of unknown function (DUF3800)